MDSEMFWRLPEVERRTGLRRVDLYRQAQLGIFPRPLKIGTRASAWRASQVVEWIAARVAAADAVHGRAGSARRLSRSKVVAS